MKRLLKIKLIIAFFILGVSFLVYAKAIYLKRFAFNDSKELAAWNRMILNGEVQYVLMKYGSEGYVQAHSDKAASALYHRIGFSLRDYPILSWKWRVLKFPDTSMAKTEKEKDDYAARVYVIFPALNFSLSKFIEYVWAKDILVGSIMDSPFGKNTKIIVVRSGEMPDSSWVSESRNIYEDYLQAFGNKPKANAGVIAIMCDADNTQSQAEAHFDDIVIQAKGF